MICEGLICVYLSGALGMQDGWKYDTELMSFKPTPEATNAFGGLIGYLSLTAELDMYYIDCFHYSGINTQESDGGLNGCIAGLDFDHGPFYFRGGAGRQFNVLGSDSRTNYLPDGLIEMTAGFNFPNSMFMQATNLSGMNSAMIGMRAEF